MHARSRRDRILTVAVGALGALLVAHAACNGLAGWALQRTLREHQRRGLPMSLSEVLPRAPADAANAAPSLIQAFALMGKGRETGGEPYAGVQAILASQAVHPSGAWGGGGTNRPPMLKPAELLARAEAPALAPLFGLIESAAEKPACRFRWEGTNGVVRLTHVPRVAQIVSLLNARALAYAATGRADLAMDDLRRSLRIAGHLRGDPFLLSQLVAASCESATVGELHRLLSATPPALLDETRMRSLETAVVASLDPGNVCLIRALDGERIVYGGRFLSAIKAQRLIANGPEGIRHPWRFRLYASVLGRPLQRWDLRRYAILMANNREWAGQSFAAAQAGNRAPTGLARMGFAGRLAPALGGVHEAVARREAALQLARVGLAAATYWRARQRYPDTLADLAVPGPAARDPFGGELIYRPAVDRASYLLYSVGANRRDDGGRERGEDGQSADLTWEVGRAAKARAPGGAGAERP
jgi:hypothetical protein